MCKSRISPPNQRRQFLQTTGLALGTTALPITEVLSQSGGPPSPPRDPSPDDVLNLLIEGNRRFVGGNITAPNRNVARLQEVAARQTPMAAFLGCADSRVPIEIIFDQGFGDIFVTRIAGNVANPEIIASLEFGTAVLGAKVLYVLGHTSCGAVTAAARGEEVPGQISTLFYHMRPAIREARGDLPRAIRENVRTQATLIAEASPVIARLVRTGRVRVAGGVYDLGTGQVTPVEV